MLLFSETRYQPRVTGWCCCSWQAGSETPHPADTVSFQMSTVWNAIRAGQPRTIKSRKVTVQDVARLVFLFCFFLQSDYLNQDPNKVVRCLFNVSSVPDSAGSSSFCNSFENDGGPFCPVEFPPAELFQISLGLRFSEAEHRSGLGVILVDCWHGLGRGVARMSPPASSCDRGSYRGPQPRASCSVPCGLKCRPFCSDFFASWTLSCNPSLQQDSLPSVLTPRHHLVRED